MVSRRGSHDSPVNATTRATAPTGAACNAFMKLPMLSADDKHTEIRRLYFKTTKATIQQDLEKALDLLKSMGSEEERERATVYMEGLAQMRKDWSAGQKNKKGSVLRAQGSTHTAHGNKKKRGSKP